MISDFIYKYYIDPVKYGEPYNIVETLTYAIILIIGVYLLYRWFSNSAWLSEHGIQLDSLFILATLPYVVLGGVLRVVQDAGMVAGDWQYLIVTPPIYFVLFFFTLGMIFIGGTLKKNGLVKNFLSFYAFIGCMAVFVILLILISWGMAHTHVDLFILAVILLMAITATVLVWACMRFVLSWEYVRDPLYISLIFGQTFGCQCHQLRAHLPPGRSLYRTARGRLKPDSDYRYRVCHVPPQTRRPLPCRLHHAALSQGG